MMGNESSQLSGLQIHEKPIEITNFWSHYHATINDSCRYFSLKGDGSVSVFKGEAALGPLWAVSTPLEKFSNNLLKYRHPCIVRYISAWQQRSILHLATEYVQPLSQVLQIHTPLQICIGINNILRALVFLHEKASMSHNNVSVSSVYVTEDGQWKLGGLQYLCSFSELTPAFLKQSRIHRYDKAVDPNEDSYEITTQVDQYAFAVFVEDVFAAWKDDDVPHLKDFKKYCRDQLQQPNPANRPKLSELLHHNFFNHEFISLYKFLNFLPLKSDDERIEFFTNILESLKCYDEETVAKQLGGLLLSRLTMLDPTARKDVIPFILKPKNERVHNTEHPGFFTLPIYKEHIKPRLMQLFGVRDSQIRMLLLTHFAKFVHVFSHEELCQHILPELLLGIKDTDDILVSATLLCLSQLVPILGADAVIGGKRLKLFTDGRPNSKLNLIAQSASKSNNMQSKPLDDFHCSENIFQGNDTDSFDKRLTLSLTERPSPVGGESIENEINVLYKTDSPVNEDDWSDWENSNNHCKSEAFVTETFDTSDDIKHASQITVDDFYVKERPEKINDEKKELLQSAALEAKKIIVDINELDIKNQKIDYSKRNTDEIDFFADMAPVIEKPTMASVSVTDNSTVSSKLSFVPNDEIDEGAWGDTWDE